MGIKLGTVDYGAVYVGDKSIDRIYLGTNLVYQQKPAYTYTGTAPNPNVAAARLEFADDWDSRYTYNNGENTIVFTSGANKIQLAAYVDGDRRGAVAWRYFPSGVWSTGHDVHTALHEEVDDPGTTDPQQDYYYVGGTYDGDAKWAYDSHNKMKIGRCPNTGAVFVSGNHHANYMKVAKSASGNHNGPWTNVPRTTFNNGLLAKHANASKRATYPQFFVFKNNLWLSMRLLKSGGGNSYWTWILYKYDHVADSWNAELTIADSDTARCYVSNVAVSPDGNRMGFMAQWRDEAGVGGETEQRDLFYCETANGTQWYQRSNINASTTNVTMPFAWDSVTETSNVNINIWDTLGNGDPKVSEMELMIDSSYHVHAIVKDQTGNFHYLKHEGPGGWVDTVNPGGLDDAGTSTGSLFEIDGTVAWVHDHGDDVRIRLLDNSYREYIKPVTISTGYGSASYSVGIDTSALAYNWLSFTTSPTLTTTNLTSEVDYPTRADVFSYPFDELFTTNFDIASE